MTQWGRWIAAGHNGVDGLRLEPQKSVGLRLEPINDSTDLSNGVDGLRRPEKTLQFQSWRRRGRPEYNRAPTTENGDATLRLLCLHSLLDGVGDGNLLRLK